VRPDGQTLLTGCKKPSFVTSGRTSLWKVPALAAPAGRQAALFRVIEHDADVTALAFRPDGKVFATGCADHLAQLWDATTAKSVGVPFQHPDVVTAVAFSPDGNLLLTGCRDRAARLWDVRTGLAVGTALRHPEAVTSVAFRGDGQRLLTGCEDGFARVWEAATPAKGPSARLLRWVERESGMELTAEGTLRTLSEVEWYKRCVGLAELGGPPASGAAPLPWHLQQALACLAAGDWPAARWQLDRQIQGQPKDALAHALRVKAELELGRPERAAADFDRALALGPADVILPHFRAVASHPADAKQGQHAMWCLDRLVRAEPKQAFAWLQRGRFRVVQGRWQEAAADMARGVDLDPSDQWSWYQAVSLQLYAGDLDTYRRLARGMLERYGDNDVLQTAERAARGCLLVPDLVVERQRLAQIADRLVTKGVKHRYSPYFELVKGMAEYRDGHFASAADWLQKSDGFSNPYWVVADQAYLALAQHQLGQSDKARRSADKAREVRDQLPRPSEESFAAGGFHDWIMAQLACREVAGVLDAPHRREAEEALRKHDWKAAAEQFTHLIDAGPAFWPDRVWRSCAYAELGREAEAKAEFARAAALAGADPSPWLRRARFYADLGRPDRAAADIARAFDVLPPGPAGPGLRSELYRELQLSPALFAKVLKLRPKDGELWLARARYHAGRDEWPKALPDYEKAVLLKPDDLPLRLDRGRCLARLGRWQESAADYQKGMESRPEDSFVWHEAAMSHLMAGRVDDYRKMCQRMLEQFSKTTKQDVASRLVYTLLQAPQAVADMDEVLRLADLNTRGGPGYGAALYRAGRLKEAAAVLEEKAELGDGQGRAWPRLFLAMAYGRLGEAGKARKYLEAAEAWIEEANRDERLYLFWAQRLEFDVLRREAREFVSKGAAE
jgi:tetratricopeptide (TPR) repeat protein